MRKLMHELCSIPGISGDEHAVRDFIVNRLKHAPSVRDIRIDRMGNCIVSVKGRQPAPHTVLFAAHMDEVGGIVTGITENGYLRFDTVGGIMDDVLYARTVYVNGHAGVIGGKAIHQCSGDEKKTIPSVKTMLIDIGADSREEALTVAKEGDSVTFAPRYFDLTNEAFSVKALDDRAGCALLLQLAETQPEYDITIAFTVQEEIGLRGATTVANACQPDIVVIVDGTTAADGMGISGYKQVCCSGGGPVVSFMDRSTLYDKDLYAFVRGLADDNGIPTQTKSMISGGNDAGAFQRAGIGAYVTAVSLPCRYIHSPSSVVRDEDAENTYRLLKLLSEKLPLWETPV